MKNQKRRPKKAKFSMGKMLLIAIMVLIAASIVCAVSYLRNHRPSVDTDVPFDITTVGPDTSNNAGPQDTDADVTPDEEQYVRDTDVVNFFVVGRDKESWNTDVMMIVNFNMKDGSLGILQIPRDTYINAEDYHGRLNAALATFRNRIRTDDPKISSKELLDSGMGKVVELLEKSMCIQLDGYVHVDLAGFKEIVNAIGGVYMDVPYEMDYEDPEQNLYIHLEPGPQLLTGEKAEMFVRFRSGYVQADIGRIDAQKIFMTALFKQLKSNLSIARIPALAGQIIKYVTTDVPLEDVIIYAKELLGVDMAKVSMMTLHGTAHQTQSGAWYYVMNRASALNMVNEYFNVYNKDITEELFDQARIFTDESYAPFSNIYYASPDDDIVEIKPDIETGEHISDGGLVIPLNPNK